MSCKVKKGKNMHHSKGSWKYEGFIDLSVNDLFISVAMVMCNCVLIKRFTRKHFFHTRSNGCVRSIN
jgi:hypothetical protein